jgi:hypothetical protein
MTPQFLERGGKRRQVERKEEGEREMRGGKEKEARSVNFCFSILP